MAPYATLLLRRPWCAQELAKRRARRLVGFRSAPGRESSCKWSLAPTKLENVEASSSTANAKSAEVHLLIFDISSAIHNQSSTQKPGRIEEQAPAWSSCMTMEAPVCAVSEDVGPLLRHHALGLLVYGIEACVQAAPKVGDPGAPVLSQGLRPFLCDPVGEVSEKRTET